MRKTPVIGAIGSCRHCRLRTKAMRFAANSGTVPGITDRAKLCGQKDGNQALNGNALMKYVAILLAAALVLGSGSAHASGALWCNADDANLKLDIESGVTHGLGSPLFNFKAAADIRDKRVLADFRTLDLSQRLVHSWVSGETKLYFYHEVEKENAIYSLDLIVESKPVPDSDGEEAGTYKLIAYGPAAEGEDGRIELTGAISCGGE